MTLSAFAWNIVRTYTLAPGRRYSFGCRYRLGTASNLVLYVSAADNDYVGVTGTFLGTPSQGVWSTARLDFSVPPGGIAKLHFGAFGGSIPGLVQQSAGTLDLYSMQIRASAFEGDSVSVTDLLADSLALPEHVKARLETCSHNHPAFRKIIYETHNDWDAAIFQYRLVGEPVVGRGPFTEFASYLDDGQAGFTTWELLRGSSIVCNLHFVAPLSAALANGDDTLSITADCYSTPTTDAAITAALLAYYTSSQVDTLLGDYRTGAAQDAETTSAITGALLAYCTAAQVDALLGDYRTASAQDTQTPSRARCWPTGRARTRTCSPPTKSPRRWWRTAQPPTRTRRRRQASPPRCSATTPSHKWTVCWPTSSESRRWPRRCQ